MLPRVARATRVFGLRWSGPGRPGRRTLALPRYPLAHGAPVHIGDPAAIGIADLSHPDYGDAVTVHEGDVPVFWACGVTPQAVVQQARPEIMITHAPGHMFITDLRDEDLAVW